MKYYQKKILLDLFESVNGLQPFTFYSRYKLKPELIVELIDSLEEKKLVEIKNNTLLLSEEGRNYVKTKTIWKKNKNKFENIPIEFVQEKLGINSFYVPNLSYISD